MVGGGDAVLFPFAVQRLRHGILTSMANIYSNSDGQCRWSME